jgi:hypothetical protein
MVYRRMGDVVFSQDLERFLDYNTVVGSDSKQLWTRSISAEVADAEVADMQRLQTDMQRLQTGRGCRHRQRLRRGCRQALHSATVVKLGR